MKYTPTEADLAVVVATVLGRYRYEAGAACPHLWLENVAEGLWEPYAHVRELHRLLAWATTSALLDLNAGTTYGWSGGQRQFYATRRRCVQAVIRARTALERSITSKRPATRLAIG